VPVFVTFAINVAAEGPSSGLLLSTTKFGAAITCTCKSPASVCRQSASAAASGVTLSTEPALYSSCQLPPINALPVTSVLAATSAPVRAAS